MNAPDKCPKCGARVMSTDVGFVRFACMSYASTTEPVRESDTCWDAERAALAARVKELEAERNSWIEYAGRLLAAGNQMRETTTAEVWDNWDKAKQTIP